MNIKTIFKFYYMSDWRVYKQKAIELYGNKAEELKGSQTWKELVENYKPEVKDELIDIKQLMNDPKYADLIDNDNTFECTDNNKENFTSSLITELNNENIEEKEQINNENTENKEETEDDINEINNEITEEEIKYVNCYICNQEVIKASCISCYVIDQVKRNYLPYLKLTISLCDLLCAKIFNDNFHKIGIDEEKYIKLKECKYLNEKQLNTLGLCNCLFLQLPSAYCKESNFLETKEKLIEYMELIKRK